jgi:outer membrane receptor for ferrienterochelin and colicins
VSPIRKRTHHNSFRLLPIVSTIGLALACLAGPAGAQQAGTSAGTAADSSAMMPAIVVTATGYEQAIKEAPASISVITRDELQTKQFRDVAEALKDVEGIDVRGATGKTGGMNISIRGMPSDYTLILIDGRRQNVAGDVTPNGFGDALTSLIPPVSAIERIEVIRGPMSTLYGSDAMGGVINIITRKVAREWGGSASLEIGIPENSDAGNASKLGFYVNGPLKSDLLGLAIRGNVFRRADSDLQSDSAGGVISQRGPSPVETRQHALGLRLTLTPDRQNDIWLDLEQNRSWYANEECELGTLDYINCNTGAATATANGYRDALRFDRDQVAFGHTGRLSFGMLKTSLTRSVTEMKGRTIPTAARPGGDPSIGTDRKLETTNTVLDSMLTAPIGERHVLAAGGQYWDAELIDGLVPDPYRQKLWALFAEDEWTILPGLVATLGARYDHHDAFGGHVSPRGYLVWTASPTLTVKGGVSNGFKVPRLNQLVDGISGISGQGTNLNIGNPNLEPETSTSTELGVIYDNRSGVTVSATAFHNEIDDKIGTGGDCTVAWISSCAANPAATYSINADKAKTWGLELSTRVALTRQWSASFNYTWTDSELIEGGRKVGKLSDTAMHIANAMVRWDATEKWSFWLRGEYRGSSRRFDGDPGTFTGNTLAEYLALGNLDGYSLFHLGGQYRVNKQVTLSANIFNLFDKNFLKFQPWQDIGGATQWGSPYFKSIAATKGSLPDGRTFWISANVTF